MKTLIIAAHPHIAQSVVNKCWLDELAKHPDRFTVHRLYTAYPDGKIDIAREQALVEAHGGIVFQFPVYWFNCPPLLKQWFDDVLTYGWAYGSSGRAFAGRKTGIAVSLGAPVRAGRPLLQCRLAAAVRLPHHRQQCGLRRSRRKAGGAKRGRLSGASGRIFRLIRL